MSLTVCTRVLLSASARRAASWCLQAAASAFETTSKKKACSGERGQTGVGWLAIAGGRASGKAVVGPGSHLARAVVGWVHNVVLVAVALHLVDAAPAAGSHETPHAALIDDLQGLCEVRVVEEVQVAQLLVCGAASGRNSGQYFGRNAFEPHCARCLHVRDGDRCK